MKRILKFLVAALTAAVAFAVVVNLNGTWTLHFSGLLSGENEPCVFEGSINVVQAVTSTISGDASVDLVSGPTGCPPQMSASILSATLRGLDFTATMDGGPNQGTLTSSGQISPDARSIRGTYLIDSGPFAGTSGELGMEMAPLLDVPLMGVAGMTVLALLLIVSALILHWR